MVGIAWVTGVRQEFETSRSWAERALAVDPQNASAHGLLGDAALELGDEDAVERHYQAMLNLHLDLGSYARAAQIAYRRGASSAPPGSCARPSRRALPTRRTWPGAGPSSR
jgi:tetratricopeptide (TPR) repeat protein